MTKHKPTAVIVIPTYNESDIIANTLSELQSVIRDIVTYKVLILIFDSNSPDGTADVVRDLQVKHDNLYLEIEGSKTGLGAAYAKAMQIAMNKFNADIVFEFDADGSHRPEYIPKMLEVIDQGADVVVGSRFVKGGLIPKDWSLKRKFLSVCGNLVARVVLSRKYKDYTSGFRATRATLLRQINLDGLYSKGYAYKIHLFWLCFRLKAKIVEYPIHFIDRQVGYSKLPKNNAIESLLLVLRLRFEMMKRYFSVCIVGLSGALIQIIVFNLLRHWFHPVSANLVAIELAILNNFVLNNFYSFRDRSINHKSFRARFFRNMVLFNVVSLGSMLIQTVIMFLGVHFIGRGLIEENVFLAMGIVLASLCNFVAYAGLIWPSEI